MSTDPHPFLTETERRRAAIDRVRHLAAVARTRDAAVTELIARALDLAAWVEEALDPRPRVPTFDLTPVTTFGSSLKPCGDCDELGRCTMNCGPFVSPSDAAPAAPRGPDGRATAAPAAASTTAPRRTSRARTP